MGAKKKPDITPAFTGRDVPINEIAQGIGKSADFIKRGLRTGALDFGYAVKSDNSDRYGYYCPDKLVWEKTGYFNPKPEQSEAA